MEPKQYQQKTWKWVIGITIPLMIVIITWIFGAGRKYTDICKIPVIESRVTTLEINDRERSSDYKWIKESMTRIERKIDNRR